MSGLYLTDGACPQIGEHDVWETGPPGIATADAGSDAPIWASQVHAMTSGSGAPTGSGRR